MAGFGKPQKHKKSIRQDASRSRIEEAIKQSLAKYQQGDLEGAKILLEKILQADHSNSLALGFLATIESARQQQKSIEVIQRSTEISQIIRIFFTTIQAC